MDRKCASGCEPVYCSCAVNDIKEQAIAEAQARIRELEQQGLDILGDKHNALHRLGAAEHRAARAEADRMASTDEHARLLWLVRQAYPAKPGEVGVTDVYVAVEGLIADKASLVAERDYQISRSECAEAERAKALHEIQKMTVELRDATRETLAFARERDAALADNAALLSALDSVLGRIADSDALDETEGNCNGRIVEGEFDAEIKQLNADHPGAALLQELTALREKTGMTMGIGDGFGSLFIHGDYESIKRAQQMVFEHEALRAVAEAARPVEEDYSHRGLPSLKRNKEALRDAIAALDALRGKGEA